MSENSLSIRPNSRPFRILHALNQEPTTWFSGIAALRRVDALSIGAQVGVGGLYNALQDLNRKGLVDVRLDPTKAKAARKVYRINERGRQALQTLAPDAFPWSPGQVVTNERATYRIIDRFPYSGRGLMFVAQVVEVRTSDPIPGWFKRDARVMIKTVRPVDTAVGDSARYLNVVNETFDIELPTLRRLINLKHVVDTVDWGQLNVLVGTDARRPPRPLQIRYVVQRRLEGQHLSAYLKNHRLTAEEWWQWARALATGLRSIHSLGTVHRDICPENIVIVRNGPDDLGKPVFVDIGEAIFRKVGGPKEPHPRKSPAEIYTAPEQRGGPIRPSRRADLYSVGAVLFFMAKGQPPDFVLPDEDALKDAVVRELRFDGSILYDDFGIADVISRCLCPVPDQRTQTADELLQDLRVRPSQEQTRRVMGTLDTTKSLMAMLMERQDDVFVALAAVEIQRVNELLDAMATKGIMIIEGTRDTIVRRLSTYIATLRGGSRYVTKTVPRFWWPANLGIRSRYFSENIELVRRGADIERLLVLTADDRVDPVVHDIVRAHLEMEADCETLRGKNPAAGHVETRYVEVPARERVRMVQTGEQRGIWISDNSAVSLIPAYDSNGVIRAVTLSRSDQEDRNRLLRQFDVDFRASDTKPLSEWATA